ncbi:MAG: thioredoxin family protein [Peptoniphilaceae bacterium]|nr:thioredoxin family protein [Peptoniphilaceae bacterium]MDD7383683.1 thioredoxin family protein [Peptoniphilaceae bacterium]MDY3738780.1 thioredoxin family protein [Peptoniphilaceae bacterium]
MIKEFENGSLKEMIGDEPTLVDFYSKTCGPCKMLSFVLNDISKSHENLNIVKVDFEANPDLIKEYNVEGYPTIVLFKNGQEVNRRGGLQQKPVIENMIKEIL